MILSGTHFILTGDLTVLGVMVVAGPTAVAGVTVAGALDSVTAMDMVDIIPHIITIIITPTTTTV